MPKRALDPRAKGASRQNTTLVVVATDAALSKAQAKHLAVMAQDGLARAIHPVHTPLDGDLVFAAATGSRSFGDPLFDLMAIGTAAAQVVARAVARGVFAASALGFGETVPAFQDMFPSQVVTDENSAACDTDIDRWAPPGTNKSERKAALFLPQ